MAMSRSSWRVVTTPTLANCWSVYSCLFSTKTGCPRFFFQCWLDSPRHSIGAAAGREWNVKTNGFVGKDLRWRLVGRPRRHPQTDNKDEYQLQQNVHE
jgi:hypothetical protein